MEKDMNMQDEEFDDLFRSKLDNFGVEPSAQIWQNIDAGLGGKKHKNSAAFILSIAASIIILVTAGILFIPKKGMVKPNRSYSNQVTVNKVKLSAIRTGDNSPAVTPEKQEQQAANMQMLDKGIARIHHPKITSTQAVMQEPDASGIAKQETVKPEEQNVFAAVTTKKSDEGINQAMIELEPAPSTVKQLNDNSAISLPLQPMLTSIPAIKTNRQTVKKRGIHNFGDLVNLVVAKVDKRKDKVIEFTDTDDDESTITGVHLGAIRIKKDN